MTIIIPSDTPDFLTTPQGALDELFPYQNVSLAGGPPSSFVKSFSIGKSYQTLTIRLATASQSGQYDIYVVSNDPAGNNVANLHYQWSLNLGSDIIVPLPIPMIVGGIVRVTLSFPTASAVVNLAVYASVNPRSSDGQMWRKDGRPYPVGLQGALGTTAAGGTLVAAPGAGSRIIVATLEIFQYSAAGNPSVVNAVAVVGGNSIILGRAVGPTNAPGETQCHIPERGILLDDNQALTYSIFQAPSLVGVTVTYDLTY